MNENQRFLFLQDIIAKKTNNSYFTEKWKAK